MPLRMPQFDASFGDKVNHLMAFCTLLVLLNKAYKFNMYKNTLLLLLYGFLIEFIQSFLPYRDFSYLDICADLSGIVLGIMLNYFYPNC